MFFLFRILFMNKKDLALMNKRHGSLFAYARGRILSDNKKREEKDKQEKLLAKKKEEKDKKDEKKEIWSEKAGTIRNRLNNKKRLSEDRWNRFAGTAESGGRGR